MKELEELTLGKKQRLPAIGKTITTKNKTMNKDELLKIYSAYLPYGLNVQLSAKDTYKNGVFPLVGIRNDGLFYMGESGMFGYVQREIGSVKPILYDLSYLTKDIEHEGEVIVLAKKIFKREWLDIAEYYVRCNQIMKLSYDNIQLLLKYHFNVFNLPESEYINKATLTNK